MCADECGKTALHPQSLQSLALLQALEHHCCFLRSIKRNGKFGHAIGYDLGENQGYLAPQALNFEARHEEIEIENSML